MGEVPDLDIRRLFALVNSQNLLVKIPDLMSASTANTLGILFTSTRLFVVVHQPGLTWEFLSRLLLHTLPVLDFLPPDCINHLDRSIPCLLYIFDFGVSPDSGK